MKKLTIIVLLLFLFSLKVNAESYYAEVNSLEEARQIGGDKLVSYKDGVAVFSSDVGIKTYKNDIMYPYYTNLNPHYYFQEDYLKEIEFENTYRNNITGAGSVIAIIDTGCDISHYDLRDNIIGCYNSTDTKNIYDVTDRMGHGTFVAGIIAASDNNIGIVGIAPEAKLYIIKASHNDEGYFYYSDIIRAINKCIELGNVNVINLSLGGYSKNELLKITLERARQNGILVVCASGNESTNKPIYPASYQIGLSVASTNDMGQLAEYSNFGINSNIAAPGLIYSTDIQNSYEYNVGTSFAAPLVSGCAGLIYGLNGNLPKNSSSADYVKRLILDNTDGKTYSSIYGSVVGRLNLQNIFKVPTIKSPKNPKIIIKENKYTKQQIITVNSKKNVDIYYSINNDSYKKLGKNLRLDKKGTYKIKFVAVKSGTKAYSGFVTEKVTVSKKVYSQEYLKSIELNLKNKKMKSGTSQQIKIETIGKDINRKRIKWSSSNPKIARIDDKGNITVADNAPKGKKVKFTAKIGSIKKVISITIR